jgi:membrane protein implicated in regulation of membrane protease activity
MQSNRNVGRFGVIGLTFITGLALLCAGSLIIGYMRLIGNEAGGGTLVAAGFLFLLVDVALVVGLATTRAERVKKTYHRLQAMVGEQGIVKDTIPAHGKGVVLVRNELWSATSSSELRSGSLVKIVKIEGILLYVEGE